MITLNAFYIDLSDPQSCKLLTIRNGQTITVNMPVKPDADFGDNTSFWEFENGTWTPKRKVTQRDISNG